ncbi:FERM domain-containing protein 5 isoform X7 [Neodiprion pinetum]|uniref:FERM domain-containing protein 5 isoform X7 n=1 Tax=Neodiprion lecontei TaxID=441921 RepID=A0ABM3GKG3_NEOLC|nr:FERM domain-containing protein 5 isoform X7 [Neodiprion fabricii]XP_046490064.1 FERM domain-containing protein 5 isoform X7 [Neodiprion pinetum]XP_046600763.1 FERM domain-containing protein 5 isoform X7 [Neodiprion lecontei]XP_046627167.1 FERM domain-containing protein 5 isoform X7 [Neodiprion virginianus]
MLKFGSKNDVTVVHRATIRLLDDTEIIQCDFQPQHKGRFILEYVCKQLNILETDYFGLRYVDHSRQRHWLDLAKTAIKQVKDMDPILFSFRVKFYPPDPFRLKEEITRYQVYQQLKRDLLHGRLYCSPGEAALLAACVVQSELGDYDPEIHEGNYISEHKLLLKQTETIEEKAMDLHQTQLKGFTPEQAETHFLRLASQLDTYAVDPHPVKDHRGSQLYLGINHCGILTFQGSRKTHHFRWPEVQKINYEGKMFIVHLTFNEDLRTKKKHTVGFKCPTGSSCRHVWRCAIEQMLFFTLPRASDAPVVSGGSIFSWGTKFKYTGRTEKEVLEETGPLRKEEPAIQRGNARTSSLRRKASSVPATPSTPSQDLVEIRYSSLPRSCHSAGLDGTGMCESGGVPFSSPYCPDNTLPLLETVSEDQEIHARRNNVGADEADTNDYYFRDSFDHSSSESQLLDATGKPHSRSVTPVPKMQKLQNSKLCLQVQGSGKVSHKRLHVIKIFVPALMLTIVVLCIVTVLIFETDTALFNSMRKTPEMVALRNQCYAPIREFLKSKFGLF